MVSVDAFCGFEGCDFCVWDGLLVGGCLLVFLVLVWFFSVLWWFASVVVLFVGLSRGELMYLWWVWLGGGFVFEFDLGLCWFVSVGLLVHDYCFCILPGS